MDPLSPPGQIPPPNPDIIISPAGNQPQLADLQAILVSAAHTVLQTKPLTTPNILLAVVDAVVESQHGALRSPLAPDVYVGGYQVDGTPNIPIAIWDAYQFFLSVRGHDLIDLRRSFKMEYLTNLIKRRGLGDGTILCLSDKNLGIAPVPGMEKELPLADHVAELVDFVHNALRLELTTVEEIRAFARSEVGEGQAIYLLAREHVAMLNAEAQHRVPDLLADDVRAAMGVCRGVREVFTALFALAETNVRQSGGTILSISSLSTASESAM